MLFSYTAVGNDGQIHEDKKEAATKDDLARELSSEGKTVVHVQEAKKKKLSLSISVFSRVKASEKIAFAKNVSTMIKAGLPLSRALSVIERQTKNPLLKKTVSGIMDDISKGSSFAEALEKRNKIFSKLFIAMVRVGEESGSLVASLSAVAFQMGKSDAIARKVRGAMVYPGIIFSIMIIVFVLIMTYVVPALVTTFASFNVALPLPTRIILGTSTLFTHHLIAIILVTAAVIAVLFFGFRTKRGGRMLDWILLRTPFIKLIVTDTNSARVARTVGSLLSSGVDMIETLTITRDVAGNSYFKDVLSEAITRIQKGESLSSVLRDHEDIYPVYMGETTLVGEETGDLAHVLDAAAEFYETEVEEKTKNISTVIEPLMMVIAGVAVGFFAIAVISPIYSLVNVIS